ncbi:MAG: hypothetical protein IJG70_02215 [Kiritimatiellae bacterium]|nr:hypothetical protein [Kiritimatiellia bacterium]
MKMKMMMGLAVAMMVAAAFADVPQVLTYRGVLLRSTGERKAEALSLTFRIYDSKAPEKALWARTLRVPVDADGVFYAELNDREGNDPDGIGRSLADAMGLVKGAPEIGLTPPDANELKPRQRLSTAPRAARASRTSAADVVYAPAGAVAGGVFIDSAAVGSVTVQEGATLKAFPKDCTLTRVEDRALGGGANSSITVRNVTTTRSNWPASFVQNGFKYTTDTAPCDMILTYDGPDGAFNAIVPAGGKVEDGGSAAQTVCGTAFGNL